jgi:hypothetical protein
LEKKFIYEFEYWCKNLKIVISSVGLKEAEEENKNINQKRKKLNN